MLIAPHVIALGDGFTMPMPSRTDIYSFFDEDDIENDIDVTNENCDIKLAEGGHVVHYRQCSDGEIKVLGHYVLLDFFIKHNKACWEFKSLKGEIVKGCFQSAFLSSNLSVKLIMPLVVLHSKGKLRTTFRFRTDPDCCVVTMPAFRRLFGETE